MIREWKPGAQAAAVETPATDDGHVAPCTPTKHLWWGDRASEAAAVVDQLLDNLGATVDLHQHWNAPKGLTALFNQEHKNGAGLAVVAPVVLGRSVLDEGPYVGVLMEECRGDPAHSATARTVSRPRSRQAECLPDENNGHSVRSSLRSAGRR
ncbi:hypothetical protein ACFYXM_21965 [Streptomyces sp. NPDC002476]|uniref:hypothetical protein n=1 Tax=Streptomyces sp. NPDC002476 TaxID=3364648 RepID=UPI0036AEF219